MRLLTACLPIALFVSPAASDEAEKDLLIPPSPIVEPEDDLLEFLTLELEQARRRISSVVYEYEFEAIHYVSLKGRLGSFGGGAVKQKGEKRSTVFRRTTSIDGKTGREVVAKSVLNEEYFAGQPYQHNMPVRYERRAADLSLEPFDLRRQLLGGFDFLQYGFGSGHETLREARAHPDRSFRWEVEETLSSNGSPLFIVKRFTPLVADPDTPTFEWVIDPSKGFLITTVRVRAIDGDIGLEHVIRVEKVGNEGVWFPTEVHETAYEPWVRGADKLKGDFFVASDGRSIARSKTFRITALEVNVAISDDEFTAEKVFGLRDGSSIVHMNASGESEVYYYVGGAEIPKEVYDDSRRPPDLDDPRPDANTPSSGLGSPGEQTVDPNRTTSGSVGEDDSEEAVYPQVRPTGVGGAEVAREVHNDSRRPLGLDDPRPADNSPSSGSGSPGKRTDDANRATSGSVGEDDAEEAVYPQVRPTGVLDDSNTIPTGADPFEPSRAPDNGGDAILRAPIVVGAGGVLIIVGMSCLLLGKRKP